MRSILLFFLILLVVALAMQAQEGDPGADVWISVNTYPPTISGCLVKWGFYYYVVGKDGTVYNLSRCTRGLGRYNSARGGTHRHPNVDHARHDCDSRSFDRPGVARP